LTVHLINTFILILLFAGAVVLEVYLSKREKRWPGLILPAIFLAASVINVLNIADVGDPAQLAGLIITTLLISNIPTAVLLSIYGLVREKIKRKKEIEKMNIQDLK
jgi:hypothetical protein